MELPTIGVIGLGQVGKTLAHNLHQNGYKIVSIYNRTLQTAVDFQAVVDSLIAQSPDEVVQNSDLILLTVKDDAIQEVVENFQLNSWENKAIVHTSGALDSNCFSSLEVKGAMVGSIHPAFPFAQDTELTSLNDVTFALETRNKILEKWLRQIVQVFSGQVILIPEGRKSLYHAAMVIASNYTVTLYAVAEQILLSIGAENSVASSALNGLLEGTLDNIQRQGIPLALTGPLVREDVQTIKNHLESLRDYDTSVLELYVQLAQLSLPMLQARNVPIENLQSVLEKDKLRCV